MSYEKTENSSYWFGGRHYLGALTVETDVFKTGRN